MAFTFLCYQILPTVIFLKVLTGIGLAHYLQAFISARHRYNQSFVGIFERSWRWGILVWMILLASLVMGYVKNPSIILLFGIHHVFSEVYIFQQNKPLYEKTRFMRILLNSVLYLCFLYAPHFGVEKFAGLYAFAALIFTGVAYYANGKVWNRELGELMGFEWVGLPLLFLFGKMGHGFSVIIFYHVVMWWLLSYQMEKVARKKIILNQLVFSVIFYLLTPYMVTYPNYLKSHQDWLITLGYIHIVTAFLISRFNPDFIRDLIPKGA